MMIIGCDLHTPYQQVAMLDTDTGELVKRRGEQTGDGEHGGLAMFWFAVGSYRFQGRHSLG